VLIDPPDGRIYGNQAGFVPILSWQPVGELAANEYYHVTFRVQRQNGPGVRWLALDTGSTGMTVSDRDAEFLRMSPQNSEVTWWVTVLTQQDAPWQQGGEGAPISPDSGTRVFLMQP
jgi:hypothetical protein